MEEIVINGGITINVNVSGRNIMYLKKIMFGILIHVMGDSAIMDDEVVQSCNEEAKTILTDFNLKKAACKTQNFYILLAFLLITPALLIVVSIYRYLIKY